MGIAPLTILGGVAKGIPFFYDPILSLEKKGDALAVPFQLAFTTANTELDLSQSYADLSLFGLQTIFIDNSASGAPTSVIASGGGPKQTLTVAPYTQGYYRLMASPEMATLQFFNNGSATVNIALINVEITPNWWFTQPPNGAQGTPVAASATTANANAVATLPNIAGRQLYVTSISLTAAGATAGLAVNATLTNVNNNGVAQTLNWSFVFPAGVTTPAQPIIESFSPPLAILPGASAVLTLPAGGAGNTQEAGSITGFYV